MYTRNLNELLRSRKLISIIFRMRVLFIMQNKLIDDPLRLHWRRIHIYRLLLYPILLTCFKIDVLNPLLNFRLQNNVLRFPDLVIDQNLIQTCHFWPINTDLTVYFRQGYLVWRVNYWLIVRELVRRQFMHQHRFHLLIFTLWAKKHTLWVLPLLLVIVVIVVTFQRIVFVDVYVRLRLVF